MKNILAGFLCVCLCISIAIFLPKVGTSNPNVDDTGCLVSGCHDFATLHTTHPGACDACHESASGGGPVASASCLACHPAEGSELCDLALAHPEAGCLVAGCHATCEEPPAGCEVTIACEATTLCTDDDCTTCTATTECDGEPVEGVYSWSLNMEGITADNGTVEICPDDLELGSNTLMVTDTANEDAEDTETLTLEECGPTTCQIDVLGDSYPKSHWIPIPIIIRIETIGIDPLNMRTPVTIQCESDGNGLFDAILQTGKFVIPPLGTNTTVIWQTGIVWPAVLTQSLELDSETCTVTVDDCPATDTFELDYLSLGPIPLSE